MTVMNEEHVQYEIRREPFGGAPVWVIGVAAAALAVLFAAALFSYNPADAHFWNANGLTPENWLGAFGANLSQALMIGMGRAAWFVPLLFAAWAWRCLGGKVHWDINAPARLIIGALVALFMVPAVFAAGGDGLGGMIGSKVMGPMARLSGSWGATWPYMLPGFFAVIASGMALFFATGCVASEARRLRRFAFSNPWRNLTSRDQGAVIGERVTTRARRLAARLRERARTAPDPLQAIETVTRSKKRERGGRNNRGVVGTNDRPIKRKRRVTGGGAADAKTRPLLDILEKPGAGAKQMTPEQVERESDLLEGVLSDYGVRGEVVKAEQGPVVTRHEFDPEPGTKASRVVGLSDDIARSMSADAARVAPVRGRSVIGIELPKPERETVYLRELLENVVGSELPLPLALGKEIDGKVKIASLTRMPHLLVAGTTGSGKSVAINGMILSLLYRHTPEECRMIMIDPKMLELSVYDGIPHLLAPVVTDPKKAVMALKWVVKEMEGRYQKMARLNVRGIDGYNEAMRDAAETGKPLRHEIQVGFDDKGAPIYETREEDPKPLPYIVVIIDEMADLMMVAGKEIEACVQRLAQMARAAGIHLITATQRPSVDVITGTIKANFPTRISFQVTSKIDSRTILGEQGAEQLLGRGDMLFMEGGGRITRVHGPFVSDIDVHSVAKALRASAPSDMPISFDDVENDGGVLDFGGGGDGDDALYDQAVAIVAKDRRATTSYIQRRLQIGYNRAARIMETMEEQGVISPANNAGKREVLIEAR